MVLSILAVASVFAGETKSEKVRMDWDARFDPESVVAIEMGSQAHKHFSIVSGWNPLMVIMCDKVNGDRIYLMLDMRTMQTTAIGVSAGGCRR